MFKLNNKDILCFNNNNIMCISSSSICSANILLDQYFEAKLGDFGQAKYATRSSSTDTSGFTHITVAETKTRLYGTRAYLAPELTANGTQSVKSDIYALGVVSVIFLLTD